MILSINIVSMETRVYVPIDEISAYNKINAAIEISINKPTIIKTFIESIEIPVLKVGWTVSINYLNPSIGYIRLSGIINCQYKESEKILADMPNDVKNEINNAILGSLASYMIETSRLHGLPSPIPIPRVDFNANKNTIKVNNDTGYHG